MIIYVEMGVDRKFDVSVCSWSFRDILLLMGRMSPNQVLRAFAILFLPQKLFDFSRSLVIQAVPQITYPTWVHKYLYSPRPIKDNILHSSHQVDLTRAANSLRIWESISKWFAQHPHENQLSSFNPIVIVMVAIKFDSRKLEQNCTPACLFVLTCCRNLCSSGWELGLFVASNNGMKIFSKICAKLDTMLLDLYTSLLTKKGREKIRNYILVIIKHFFFKKWDFFFGHLQCCGACVYMQG